MGIPSRQQAEAVPLNKWGVFDPGFVVGESFFRRQAARAYVDTGFLRIPSRHFDPKFQE